MKTLLLMILVTIMACGKSNDSKKSDECVQCEASKLDALIEARVTKFETWKAGKKLTDEELALVRFNEDPSVTDLLYGEGKTEGTHYEQFLVGFDSSANPEKSDDVCGETTELVGSTSTFAFKNDVGAAHLSVEVNVVDNVLSQITLIYRYSNGDGFGRYHDTKKCE